MTTTTTTDLDEHRTKDLRQRLEELLARRILILDGAMGTMIQRHGLEEADFRGERFADHARRTSRATTTCWC